MVQLKLKVLWEGEISSPFSPHIWKENFFYGSYCYFLIYFLSPPISSLNQMRENHIFFSIFALPSSFSFIYSAIKQGVIVIANPITVASPRALVVSIGVHQPVESCGRRRRRMPSNSRTSSPLCLHVRQPRALTGALPAPNELGQ